MGKNDHIGSEDDYIEEMEAEACRPEEPNEELQVFDAVRAMSAHPVTPTKLTAEDSFTFRCHKGVSCWNRCCHGADITLTPWDIVRLSRHLGLSAADFLAQYTVPAFFPRSNLPVAKLKMAGEEGKGACAFVAEAGCSVYEHRPQTCRYYPLGLVSMKMKDAPEKQDFHFLVREDHCKGHEEKQEISVALFRDQQGVLEGEAIDRGWIDILMKMASWSSIGGPMGKAPTPQAQKMFFMATTDVSAFRRFILSTKFLETYEVAPEAIEDVKADDEAALRLAFDWLKAVLFNEPTLPMKETVLQAAIAKAHKDMAAGGD
jgi:Fe-S-cluster containining protein